MYTYEFPGLGLEFDINRVAFRIFDLPIYWYGILIAIGFILAVLLAIRHCKSYDIEQDTILDAVLYATPVAIIFARLFYVIFNWADFKGSLVDIINTRKGGLAIYGAVIGALLVGYIYSRVKKINFLKLVDFCMVYFPLAQGIGRWGNFINQEAYGGHTNLPWRMNGTNIINGPVHPTFLYEFLWNMGVFLILLSQRKRKKFEGEVLFLYLVLYGLGRAWIELLRTDSLMIGNLKVNFLLSVLLVLVFGILLIYKRVRIANRDLAFEEGGESIYANIMKTAEDEKKDMPRGMEQDEDSAEEIGNEGGPADEDGFVDEGRTDGQTGEDTEPDTDKNNEAEPVQDNLESGKDEKSAE